MQLIKRVSECRKEPVWEVVIDGESIIVTTRQLQIHALFSKVVLRNMLSSTTGQGFRGFSPLLRPMTRNAWEQMVREALTRLQTVSD